MRHAIAGVVGIVLREDVSSTSMSGRFVRRLAARSIAAAPEMKMVDAAINRTQNAVTVT
ncbi:hypothetical protein Aros01_08462 [Streptosporangium roseum]|uniref:Uncharacterized protein n=1 Tax=Streptosporangium roseum (strain ATCC 12428 / DSM 43021 / JCM 3005 / KCTC 9067 / NCIMB 10171 / NRRL 2505 / NI 9100) TaxID=479432 RepID=D2B486_STRRD|nr:hypothetical protein Sros_8678 [Streptosporangium roseum DSM 43021]